MLSHLRKDSRITLTNLSKETGHTVSTAFERLKSFKETGLIRLTALIIDYSRLGFLARVMVAFKVDRDIRGEVETYLIGDMHVNSIQRINNGYTFLVEIVHFSMSEAEDYIEILEERFNVKKEQVYYVIEDIRRERFFSEPDMVDFVFGGKD